MGKDVSRVKDHPMKKEKEPAGIPSSEKPDTYSSIKTTEASASSIYRAANGALIDFHSAEFNHTDDLNDCSGNYRSFEPLDGIVTADMRHQMERLREEGCGDAPEHDTPTARTKERKKRIEEIEPAYDLSPLTVISEGRTLIVDTDVERAMKCREILSRGHLTCTLVLTKKAAQDAPPSFFDRLTLIEADDVEITGAFGGFSVTVTVQGEQRRLTDGFDLVLDLRPAPPFAGTRLPVGYYAPGPNPEELNRVMEELPGMRGRFKKPRFMIFLTNRCFHGRSRKLDCLRCTDICPSGAIRSEKGNISFNHYLCQGCGGCALVCPADAIQPIHPSPEELLNSLRERLTGHEADTAMPMTVVISDRGPVGTEELHEDETKGGIVDFQVEEIGRIGLDAILTAFSHGADKVVVACDSENPQGIRDAVAWQAYMARAVLKGLGMQEDKCRFIVPAEEGCLEEASKDECIEGEAHNAQVQDREPSAVQGRRPLIRLAAQRLAETSGSGKQVFPLPAGSYFGAVTIDARACTLCMACVAACPSHALAAGGEVPRLLFVESQCHQCGLCRETCPENAVQLLPRMMLDQKQVDTPVVLCEEEVFRCVKCDAPFAPKTMVNRMTEKLKEHWMYTNERQLRRLKMCRVCRTRDALASEDMKLWNR